MNLLLSLLDPCPDTNSKDKIYYEHDPALDYNFESLDLIWSYRINLLLFIISIISAPEETSERILLRSEMESQGLRNVFKYLREWNPPSVVIEHIQAYEEDSEEDKKDYELSAKEANDLLW